MIRNISENSKNKRSKFEHYRKEENDSLILETKTSADAVMNESWIEKW